jgi:hypothetical protein
MENDDLTVKLENEINSLIDNSKLLLKVNDKFKGKKEHGKQLRIFLEDMEKNLFNIFNYIQEKEGKPIKKKMTKLRGSYNKNNIFLKNHIEKINKSNKIELDVDNLSLNLDESSDELKPRNELSKMMKRQEDILIDEIIERIVLLDKTKNKEQITLSLKNIVKDMYNKNENMGKIDILLLIKTSTDDEIKKLFGIVNTKKINIINKKK